MAETQQTDRLRNATREHESGPCNNKIVNSPHNATPLIAVTDARVSHFTIHDRIAAAAEYGISVSYDIIASELAASFVAWRSESRLHAKYRGPALGPISSGESAPLGGAGRYSQSRIRMSKIACSLK